jgi:hypothetical protein
MPYTTAAAAAPPSTPLGPWVDSAVAWTTRITLMGLVGLTVLALAAVAAPARRASPGTLAHVTTRLVRVAAVLGVLAVPAVLTLLAQGASETGGYDYSAAWDSLYDGSVAGLLSGLEITFSLVGAALIAPLAFGAVAASRLRNWLLGAGLGAGAVSLTVTKFPDDSGGDLGKTVIETVIGAGDDLRGRHRTERPVPVLGARRWPRAAVHHHVRTGAWREDHHLRRPAAAWHGQPVLAAPPHRGAARGRRPAEPADDPGPAVPRRHRGRAAARSDGVARCAVPARLGPQPGVPGTALRLPQRPGGLAAEAPG